MSASPARAVNVVPLKRIKKEVISETEEDDMVKCRICCKSFCSEVALRNHAKMEHFDAFLSGDPKAWTDPESLIPKRKKIKEEKLDPQEMEIRRQEVIAAMSKGKITSLASEDVGYIIIKSDDAVEEPTKKKRLRLVKVSDGKKETPKEQPVKKQKEVQPITGPFECVQPSNLVADGVCHQIFFSCCEYSMHHRDEHTRRRKGLRCQVCEKPLAAGDDGRPPFTCDVCGAGFERSQQLSEHTSAAHVKLKPFQCDICLKRFTQMGGVQQHMRMHTGDRPFPCTFCPKSFTQKSGLDQHLRIHTKVKPYRCVICSKTFCQSVHLKQHMRTHTNVSPFQCGICQKRFKQSSHLNYHLKNHNPVNMTEEQKQKYNELMGMMNKEVVEIEIHEDQSQEETEQNVVEEIEQAVAEQSIQVIEENDGYVLQHDDGDETWTVHLVES